MDVLSEMGLQPKDIRHRIRLQLLLHTKRDHLLNMMYRIPMPNALFTIGGSLVPSPKYLKMEYPDSSHGYSTRWYNLLFAASDPVPGVHGLRRVFSAHDSRGRVRIVIPLFSRITRFRSPAFSDNSTAHFSPIKVAIIDIDKPISALDNGRIDGSTYDSFWVLALRDGEPIACLEGEFGGTTVNEQRLRDLVDEAFEPSVQTRLAQGHPRGRR